MPQQTYSYSSATYSSSSTTTGGQTTGQVYQQTAHSDQSGTTVQTTRQNLGEQPVQETRQFDSQGRELLEGAGGAGGQGRLENRVEDVTEETENDKLYRERMEDEYAKREGGA